MSLLDCPIGDQAPEIFNTIIEIPRGSTVKYEVDAKTGLIRLDRVLFSPLFYPCDYGYIPQTLYLDGDPLDVLVILTHPTFPGCIIEAAPIGVLKMSDDKGPDEKILAVATKDPRFGYFFEVYKQLEKKEVEIHGWEDHDFAVELVQKYRITPAA